MTFVSLLGVVGAVISVVGFAPSAHADGVPDVTLTVYSRATNPTWSECSGGARTWTLYPEIQALDNSATEPATLSSTNILVAYTTTGGGTVEVQPTVVSNGGFEAGAVLQPGGNPYFLELSVDLPCNPDPTEGWVVAEADLQGGSSPIVSAHTSPNITDFTFAYMSVQGAGVISTNSSGCSGGQATATLTVALRVINRGVGPQQALTITSVEYTATYSEDNPPGNQEVPAQVVDPGGLVSGTVLVPGQELDVTTTAAATLPCNGQAAELKIEPHSNIGDQGENAVFYFGNALVPLGTIGAVGFALLLALGLLAVQRRAVRRRRSLASQIR